jgi:hypothetical protein
MKHRAPLVVVLAVLIGGLLGAARAEAQNLVVIDCRPIEVASLEGRIHVLCSTGRNGIVYFALGTNRSASETAFAVRAVSLASTAIVSGRSLSIRFDPADTSGTAIGCLANDCRLIHTIYLR